MQNYLYHISSFCGSVPNRGTVRILHSLHKTCMIFTIVCTNLLLVFHDLLKICPKRGGCIFKSYDISLENTPTSHAVLVMYACSDSTRSLCQYAITANGACLNLLVPPLAQCCFFSASWAEKSIICLAPNFHALGSPLTICQWL